MSALVAAHRPEARPRGAGRRQAGWLAVLGALLLAAGGSVWHLWPQARANAVAMQALAQVRAWQIAPAREPDTASWLQARADLGRALAMAPDSADLHEAMAYLYLSAAQRAGVAALVQGAYLNQALVHLRRAISQRPMVPSAWVNVALALHQLAQLAGEPEASDTAAMWRAFDRAMAYGQRERAVQQGLATVAFAHWPALAAGRRQAVLTMVAQATPSQQRALLALARRHQVALALVPG